MATISITKTPTPPPVPASNVPTPAPLSLLQTTARMEVKEAESDSKFKTGKETSETLSRNNDPVNSSVDNLNSDKVYDGDRLDTTPPIDNGKWEVISFESPFELINFFDRHLNSGRASLHGWQMEELEALALAKPTDKHPHREALCAANGSGKDKYIIAPFVIWFALTKIRSLTVITSSSGVQLTAQTENYISSLAHEINTYYGRAIFKITRRFIKCLKSGSEIRMFATDEAGRAEGYHPLEPDAEMAIIVNEGKSVAPDIFGALSRCTGYNYWINVSTPGEPYGDFYDSFTNWPNTRRVTAYDCPHLGEDHILEVKRKYGEGSAIFRSQILALFTAIGGQCVINQDYLNRCIDNSIKKITKIADFGKVRIGIDLAAGRDECAFVASKGNKPIDKEYFVERDTTLTEDRAEKFILKHGGKADITGKDYGECEIFADDGGLGHAIIDRLVRKGYNIVRVLNQSRALNPTQFGNRGAEMWFNFARLIEECLIVLELNQLTNHDDKKLYEQLAYRHYKKTETQGRITLESKEEARANGHVSPDRADAYVLSFCATDIDEITKAIKDAQPPKRELGMSYEQLRDEQWKAHRKIIMGETEGGTVVENCSIETLMALRNN